jgi:hypothetical protein
MKGGFFFSSMIAHYMIVIAIILAVVIFFLTFKYHIKQTVVEYYLWGKQYDIPLTLFSVNVEGESSIVALNRIYYGNSESKGKLIDILDDWFGKVYYYRLTFGGKELTQEGNPWKTKPDGGIQVCKCQVQPPLHLTPCEDPATKTAPHNCKWKDVKAMKILGKYPLPIIDEDPKVIELNFTTLIPRD